MKKNFTDYETAKRLKELGMDEKCFDWYYAKVLTNTPQGDCYIKSQKELDILTEKFPAERYLAPLWQQVKAWLWEEHKIWLDVTDTGLAKEGEKIYSCFVTRHKDDGRNQYYYASPITAEIEGIKQAVKYLTEQKK